MTTRQIQKLWHHTTRYITTLLICWWCLRVYCWFALHTTIFFFYFCSSAIKWHLLVVAVRCAVWRSFHRDAIKRNLLLMTGIYNMISSDYERHHHLMIIRTHTHRRDIRGTGRELNRTCEIAAVYVYIILLLYIYSEESFLFLPRMIWEVFWFLLTRHRWWWCRYFESSCPPLLESTNNFYFFFFPIPEERRGLLLLSFPSATI